MKLFGADEVIACDIDDAALEHAKDSSLYASQITWIHSDVYESIPEQLKFDTIVSNPPQLPSLNVESAHDYGGPDGLSVIHKILLDGKRYLKPDGKILLLVFDFLYDYKNSSTKESLKSIATELGYESKVVASYERDVKPSGKTFENMEYIEETFPSFRFKKDRFNKIRHNFHIIEFKVLAFLLANSLYLGSVSSFCDV
jgi:methylase of polypeptide subunit release factors